MTLEFEVGTKYRKGVKKTVSSEEERRGESFCLNLDNNKKKKKPSPEAKNKQTEKGGGSQGEERKTYRKMAKKKGEKNAGKCAQRGKDKILGSKKGQKDTAKPCYEKIQLNTPCSKTKSTRGGEVGKKRINNNKKTETIRSKWGQSWGYKALNETRENISIKLHTRRRERMDRAIDNQNKLGG